MYFFKVFVLFFVIFMKTCSECCIREDKRVLNYSYLELNHPMYFYFEFTNQLLSLMISGILAVQSSVKCPSLSIACLTSLMSGTRGHTCITQGTSSKRQQTVIRPVVTLDSAFCTASSADHY